MSATPVKSKDKGIKNSLTHFPSHDSTTSRSESSRGPPEDCRYFSADKGEVIHDRYEIQQLVGYGRFSKVYKVIDKQTDATVALKIYRASNEFLEYFQHEVDVLERIKDNPHPNLLNALGVFVIEKEFPREEPDAVEEINAPAEEGLVPDAIEPQDDTTTNLTVAEPVANEPEDSGPLLLRFGCIVYEYAQTDFKKLLRRHDKLAWTHVLTIVQQVAAGLDHLHGQGVIHADIKPENMLLDADTGLVKICDVGSCVFVDNIDTFSVGTVPYIAPELILGVEYGTPVDVWSLGCLVFELLTGENIFDPDHYFTSDYSDTSSGSWSSGSVTGSDDEETASDKDEAVSKEGTVSAGSSSTGTRLTTSSCSSGSCDESYMQGIDFEKSHFQLASFRNVLGRIPVEYFENGRYYNSFYKSNGRMYCVPRHMDTRSIAEILKDEFEIEESVATDAETFMLWLFKYLPTERPTCKQIHDAVTEKLKSVQ